MNTLMRGAAMAAFGLLLSGAAAHADAVVVNVTAAPVGYVDSRGILEDYYSGSITFDQPVYLENNEQLVINWTFGAPLPFSREQDGMFYLFAPSPSGSFASSLGDFSLRFTGYNVFSPGAGGVTLTGFTELDGARALPNPSGAPDLVGPLTGFDYDFGMVPEPGAWALLMTGMALVGGVLRQARSRAQTFGRSA